MKPQVSVITCSHNPRKDYLDQVIEALKIQTLDKQLWEYLLIDNASSESLEVRIDISWQSNARHIREGKLGLTHARLRGICEAQGDILVFVDDDNVLDSDYLEKVIEIAEQHPNIGAWCGQRRPVFEQEPPSWTRRHWSHLALHEFEEDIWSNQPNLNGTMPNGAGLCVRKSVAGFYATLHATGKRAFVMDRKGSSLVSGGDVDLAWCACDLGMGVGLFASLRLEHLIPAERLRKTYLLRLAEEIGYSDLILRSFRQDPFDDQVLSLPSKMANFIRYALMGSHERQIQRANKIGVDRARRELLKVRSISRNGHK